MSAEFIEGLIAKCDCGFDILCQYEPLAIYETVGGYYICGCEVECEPQGYGRTEDEAIAKWNAAMQEPPQ